MSDNDETAPVTDAAGLAPRPLFFENGASWYWLLAGPVAGVAMLLIELWGGAGPRPLVPLVFVALVSGFIAVQVKAARIHTSVELTPDTLRQGTEITQVRDIVRVYPDPDSPDSGMDADKWQSARALGELTGVPRGRKGIGVRLSEGRTAQAWARRHRDLRAALTGLVDGREP
jgi:hypothetical protein